MVVGKQHGGGAVFVRAVRCRRTVGQGSPGVTAIGRGGNNLAKGHVRGDGHIAHVHMHAAFTRTLGGFNLGNAVHVLGYAVGIGVVVAVAGGVAQHFAHGFVALEVGFAGFNHFLEGQLLVFEHQLFYG